MTTSNPTSPSIERSSRSSSPSSLMSRRSFDDGSKRPISLPTVKIEMVTSGSPSASSPNLLQDVHFLSPRDNVPPRRRHSTDTPRRPSSAPPTTTTFDFHDEYQRKALTPLTHSFQRNRHTSFAEGAGVGGPERPSPLLLRPTTFWKNTRRSGVTAASYSPSSHLIRRSTFIAAGLTLDKPVADLSALGVESRIGVIVLPSDTSI